MTDTVNLDAVIPDPILLRSKFTFEFEVTGPAYPRPYSSVLMVPRSVRVTVELRDGAPVYKELHVFGSRAKKDGTASGTLMEDRFYISAYAAHMPPDYILDVGTEAVRLVTDMLRGTGEVTV